jgi:hypothetical protein
VHTAKFIPGDIVEYRGHPKFNVKIHALEGAIGYITAKDMDKPVYRGDFVQVTWVTVPNPEYLKRVVGINPDNLVKIGRVDARTAR